MEEKKIDNTKSKLYVLCSDILNPVYATVQGSHAVAQYLIDHINDTTCWKNETIVFLYYPHLELQRIVKDKIFIHSKIGYPISVWKEPDLNNACSAIAFWNKDLKDIESSLDDSNKHIAVVAQDVLDSLSVVSDKAYDNSATYISNIRIIKKKNHYDYSATTQIIVVTKNGNVLDLVLDKPFEEYHYYEIRDAIELKYAIHFDEENFYSKMEEGNVIDYTVEADE